jgi:hypothetical protein
MAKFSDSSYQILKNFFMNSTGWGSSNSDSWLLGIKSGILADGGVDITLYEDNPDYGFVPYSFTIYSIDGNKFKMTYNGNSATWTINNFPVSAAMFSVGNNMYFRKDSTFYSYLKENVNTLRNFINTNRDFCYFGKIWPISGESDLWNIEFYGMKDYMESAIPLHNRTTNLVELIDVWFDQVNHEPYNMTKYLWALLDAKEVDFRWLGYIARMYGVDVSGEINETTSREWVDLLIYFLKRIGTYNALYIVYKVFSGGSKNAINIYERWDEWCASGAGDIPSFKQEENFSPGINDFHWLEFYGIQPSGGAGNVWYDQFTPSGAPTPNPYSIQINSYPTHSTHEPAGGCNVGSATPTGSLVITPHYVVEVDLTTEPIGDNFDTDWILNEFYINEFVRNWEYVRPVGKYVTYQELISPACKQSRTGETETLYPLSSLGYFNTIFTGSQFLSGASPTPSGGEVSYIYTQHGASANWTITHSLSSSVLVQVWQPASGPAFYPLKRVIPSDIEVIDDNTLQISFDSPISGIANIAGHVDPRISNFKLGSGSNWSIIHKLGTTAPSGYPEGSLVNYYIPNGHPTYKIEPENIIWINKDETDSIWDSSQSGIAFTRNADYVHTQTTPSTAWNINHNMNSDGIIIQTFDSSNKYINPKDITLTDQDNILVEFESDVSGKAYLLYFKRDVIARTNNSCDITGTGICPSGMGYWKVGNGTTEGYDYLNSNDLESPTASGDYWRVWEDGVNYYIDFIVPTGEDLDIREVGLFNVNGDMIYYSKCTELYKPKEVQTVFHYRSKALD